MVVALLVADMPRAASARSAIVVGAVDCSSIPCELRDAKIDGDINSSTVEKVRRLLELTHDAAVQHKTDADFAWGFELDSQGGSVAAAMAIGRLFRKERVWVTVPYWAQCHSACVLILVGAVNRLIFGKVGIHRPFLEVPQQEVTPEIIRVSYQHMLQDLRTYFSEMDISEQLADDMLRIEPSNIRLLNDAALVRYGITPTDPIEQETMDLQDAQFWGINDRQEYIRRKSFAATTCPGRFGVPDIHTTCYQAIMKTGRAPVQAPNQSTDDFSQYGSPLR